MIPDNTPPKRKWLRYLIASAIVLHVVTLHVLGISGFTTTILFYFLLYTVLKFLFGHLRNKTAATWLTLNTRNLFFLLLILEFLLLFVFNLENNYVENRTGFYLSPYKKDQLIERLQRAGFSAPRINTRSGNVPNSQGEHRTGEFTFPVRYNSLGLRGQEPDLRDTACFRILILGDSYTEGFGAPADSTFPVLLESMLKQHYQRPIEVLNAGICGSNPIDEIALYRSRLQEYPADLVLMVSNLTDIFDIEYNFHPNQMPVSEYFVAVSHLYRLFYWGMFRQGMGDAKTGQRVQARRTANIRQLTDSLNRFENLLTKQGKRFALVYLPMHQEVRYFYQDIPPTPALAEAYRSMSIPLIDLRTPYRAQIHRLSELDQYYWHRDGHHTPKGYLLMARSVADALISKNWIPVSGHQIPATAGP